MNIFNLVKICSAMDGKKTCSHLHCPLIPCAGANVAPTIPALDSLTTMGRRYGLLAQETIQTATFNAAMKEKLVPAKVPGELAEGWVEVDAATEAQGLDLADRHDPGALLSRKQLYHR